MGYLQFPVLFCMSTKYSQYLLKGRILYPAAQPFRIYNVPMAAHGTLRQAMAMYRPNKAILLQRFPVAAEDMKEPEWFVYVRSPADAPCDDAWTKRVPC